MVKRLGSHRGEVNGNKPPPPPASTQHLHWLPVRRVGPLWKKGIILVLLLGASFYQGGQQHSTASWSNAIHQQLPFAAGNVAKRNVTLSTTTKNTGNRSSPEPKRSFSIVVALSGEMGNNLGKIAFGKYLQWRLLEEYRVETQLVLKHQDASKWVRARKDSQACFVNLRGMDFELGNTPEYGKRSEAQREWLGEHSNRLELVHLQTLDRESLVNQSLDFFSKLVGGTTTDEDQLTLGRSPPPTIPPNANITVPFLLADAFAYFGEIDKYYPKFREFFVFDELECCNELPAPDESAFHFRNFISELGERTTSTLGFEELTANNTASKLFGHLEEGTKVAITTRIKNAHTQEYVAALEARGLQVRLVTGQTGPQDFCFLRNVQRDLAGSRISSFFVWASILSKAEPDISWYTIDSRSTRQRQSLHNSDFHNLPHNWTFHPELAKRTKFLRYPQ